MSEQTAATSKKHRFNPGMILFSVLVVALISTDYYARRAQTNALEKGETKKQVPEFLERMIQVGRVKSNNMTTFNDNLAEPVDRLQAARNLTQALKQAEREEELAQWLRTVMEKLGNSVDLDLETNELLTYYTGGLPKPTPKPLPKPLPKPQKDDAKEAEPPEPRPRDDEGLRWVARKRMDNIRMVYTDAPVSAVKGLGNLTSRLAGLELYQEMNLCLAEAFRHNYDPKAMQTNFDTVRGLVSAGTKAKQMELIESVSNFWFSHFSRFSTLEIPDSAYAEPAAWYRLSMDKRGNPAAKPIIFNLLCRLHDKNRDSLAPAAAIIMYEIYMQENERQQADALENQMVQVLENRIRGKNPELQDFQYLAQIYEKQERQQELERVNALWQTAREKQQRRDQFVGQRRRVVQELGRNRLAPAQKAAAGIFRNFTGQKEELPEYPALQVVLGLLTALRNDLEAAKQLPKLEKEFITANILGFPPEQVGLLIMQVYEKARDAGDIDLARELAGAAKDYFPEDSPRQTWIDGELWLLDGAKGSPPGKLRVWPVPYIQAPQIKLDGRLDEAVYQQFRPLTEFIMYINLDLPGRAAPAETATSVWLFHDNQNLYVAMHAKEPDMAGSPENFTERDANMWTNDCLELFLGAELSTFQYQQWIINQIGTIQDMEHTNIDFFLGKRTTPGLDFFEMNIATFNTDAQAAGNIQKESWSLELILPLADIPGLRFPCNGAFVPGNVRRLRVGRDGNYTIVLGWNDQTGFGHSRELFNLFKFE